MANIKQQMKRILTNNKRNVRNASFRSSLKTAINNVTVAVENKDLDKANEALAFANKKLDKSVSQGINHKNKAARVKSRLAKLVNTLK